MKKILVFFLLLFVIGCTPTTDEPSDPVETQCLETETKVNGECIALEGYQILLNQAFEQTKQLDNYTVLGTITTTEESTDFTMKFDGDTYYFKDINEEQITVASSDQCSITIITEYSNETTTGECNYEPMIHHAFMYHDFTILSGRYQFVPTVNDSVPYFSNIEQGELTNLSLSLSDGYLYDIDLTIEIDDIEHLIHLEYTDITTTTIDLVEE